MYKDKIISEIHEFRGEYAKLSNYDLSEISEDLRKKQAVMIISL